SRETLLDAALAAFSGRVRLDESCERRPEEVITEIFAQLFDRPDHGEGPRERPPSPGGGGRVLAGKDASSALREGSRRTRGRAEMAGAHPDFELISPALGQLDEEAFEELRHRDPDAATGLLSDLVTATDRDLRRRANRLAASVFVGL